MQPLAGRRANQHRVRPARDHKKAIASIRVRCYALQASIAAQHGWREPTLETPLRRVDFERSRPRAEDGVDVAVE
eukprot:7376563-Prymnesium_polylepis.3